MSAEPALAGRRQTLRLDAGDVRRGGPMRAHAMKASTATGSPSTTISTRPSSRLRAEPQAEPNGLALRAGAEPHALHAAVDQHAPPHDVIHGVRTYRRVRPRRRHRRGARVRRGADRGRHAHRPVRAGPPARRCRSSAGCGPITSCSPFPAFAATLVVVIVLVQLPLLDWGWWSALGGIGNPVTGGTERTTGTALEWIVPLVFITMLIPALPLFAEAEERMFRLGAQRRSRWGRLRRSVEFGLAHAIIGIPIGAALGLSCGGLYFTWRYMRVFDRTNDENAAMLESTRAHTAYNATVIVLIAAVLIFGADA